MSTISENETQPQSEFQSLIEAVEVIEDLGPLEDRSMRALSSQYPGRRSMFPDTSTTLSDLKNVMSGINTLDDLTRSFDGTLSSRYRVDSSGDLIYFFEGMDRAMNNLIDTHRDAASEFARVVPIQNNDEDDFI